MIVMVSRIKIRSGCCCEREFSVLVERGFGLR